MKTPIRFTQRTYGGSYCKVVYYWAHYKDQGLWRQVVCDPWIGKRPKVSEVRAILAERKRLQNSLTS
jgi:hypothetical protein